MSMAERLLLNGGPTAKASPEQLQGEYQVHMSMARDYLRKALEAEEAGAADAKTLFMKAVVEQNAALLCTDQINSILMVTLIGLIIDPCEDDASERGAVQ